MVKFYEHEGRIYRFLGSTNDMTWVIDYEKPGKPIMLSRNAVNGMKEIPVPDDYIDESDVSKYRNAAMEKRFNLIEPLLNSSVFITNGRMRTLAMETIAKENDLSVRTVCRYYFGYLAKGKRGLLPKSRCRRPKGKNDKNKQIIQKAISEFYCSSKRPSVRAAYELMLMKYYRTEEGVLLETRPSINQFRYILQQTRDLSTEIIAREGLGEFKVNHRPLLGRGDSGVNTIGFYEIDATVADIYVVSRYDRTPVGRPIIYVAVDVASRLIAGIHVGLEENADAVICCLGNAAQDKVEYCAKYGITIRKEQWPSEGMPGHIYTDRGTDFVSNRCKELCMMFGLEITSLPAYRPDLKGYVERAIGYIQERYKPLLRDCGVVDKVKVERAAPNFAQQAVFTLEEFTKIIIDCVLYYNAFHVLNDYIRLQEMITDNVAPIAANVWNWYKEHGKDNTIQADAESLRRMLLPRGTGRMTRRGVEFNGLYYFNRELNGEFVRAGVRGSYEVTIAYHPNDNEYIYLVDNGVYHFLQLTQASGQYGKMSHQETALLLKNEKKVRKDNMNNQVIGAVNCVATIESMKEATLKKRGKITPEDTLTETKRERREREKRND